MTIRNAVKRVWRDPKTNISQLRNAKHRLRKVRDALDAAWRAVEAGKHEKRGDEEVEAISIFSDEGFNDLLEELGLGERDQDDGDAGKKDQPPAGGRHVGGEGGCAGAVAEQAKSPQQPPPAAAGRVGEEQGVGGSDGRGEGEQAADAIQQRPQTPPQLQVRQ